MQAEEICQPVYELVVILDAASRWLSKEDSSTLVCNMEASVGLVIKSEDTAKDPTESAKCLAAKTKAASAELDGETASSYSEEVVVASKLAAEAEGIPPIEEWACPTSVALSTRSKEI